MKNLSELEKKNGTVSHKGQTIVLAEQAAQTSRLLTEYPNDLQYQGSGDIYVDEWEAQGYKLDGTSVRVRWHFKILRKTQDDYDEPQLLSQSPYLSDTEPEWYDWDNVHDVIDDDSGDTRDFTLRIRLTDAERTQIQDTAGQNGMNMSEYVRRKIF